MSAFQSKMDATAHGAREGGLEGTVAQTDKMQKMYPVALGGVQIGGEGEHVKNGFSCLV